MSMTTGRRASERRPNRATIEREIRSEQRLGALALVASALITAAIAYAVTYAVQGGRIGP